MKKFPLIDRVYNRLREKFYPITGPKNRKKLNNLDFTIISNNCWAGIVYQHFNLVKNSPTVGLYFFPDDYIRFISNLKYYTSIPLEIISIEKAKHKEEIIKMKNEYAPIGRLKDVEIVFLHYKTGEIAKEKWARRVERINWDNIIIKFSYMNGCTDEHIHMFEKIQNIKKFSFVTHPFSEYSDCIVIPGNNCGQIDNDTFYYDRYINLVELINMPKTRYH